MLPRKLPSDLAVQTDGSFFDRSFRFTNYRQKHRQKFLLPRMHFLGSEDILRKINYLEKEGISIDNAPWIVAELSHNPLFFLRYFPPEPSTVSHTPHSHSIVPGGFEVMS